MSCPKGGNHNYKKELIDGTPRLVCQKCGHVSETKLVPSYSELQKELKRIKANGIYLSRDVWTSDLPVLLYKLRKPEPMQPERHGWLYFVPDATETTED